MQIADLFCGSGGFTSGAERALADLDLAYEVTAVNHWDVAVATHRANFPAARHLLMDVQQVTSEMLAPNGALDLLLASPSCVHFSRARGGRPSSDQQRSDPWTILRFCTELRVARVLVENVPDLISWGPISSATGKPIKRRRGEYFAAWVKAFQAIGYTVEWRILNAADYGDATTRHRFFLQARCDGVPITWPASSHAPPEAGPVLFRATHAPWRAAREIIDWSHVGRSILTTRDPLADNTLRRIAAGLRKFSGPLAEAFVAALHAAPRKRPTTATQPPKTRGHRTVAEAIALPPLEGPIGSGVGGSDPCTRIRFTLGQQSGSAARRDDQPLATISTAGAIAVIEAVAHAIPTPFLVPQFGEREGQSPRVHSVDAPLPAVTSHGAGALVVPILTPVMVPRHGTDGSADADGVLALIDGQLYRLDIRFRMLEPRELARAMSLDDGDATYVFTGTKTAAKIMIGNAVPVRTARALIRSMMADAVVRAPVVLRRAS